jgi:hypothetical protein
MQSELKAERGSLWAAGEARAGGAWVDATE